MTSVSDLLSHLLVLREVSCPVDRPTERLKTGVKVTVDDARF